MITNIVFVFLLASVVVVKSDHLILGSTENTNSKYLMHHSVALYCGFPYLVREKYFFYNDDQQRIIKSITVYDNLQSKATASVTAGGIGYSYVNIKMISERGKGLDYDIGIYA